MDCIHPDHNDAETCGDRAVGCHTNCRCCMGISFEEAAAAEAEADAALQVKLNEALANLGKKPSDGIPIRA